MCVLQKKIIYIYIQYIRILCPFEGERKHTLPAWIPKQTMVKLPSGDAGRPCHREEQGYGTPFDLLIALPGTCSRKTSGAW